MVGRTLSLTLVGLMLTASAQAERVTLLVRSLPEGTPRDAVLTLAASLNGWNPAAPGFAFSRQGDGTHRLEIDVRAGTLVEYKITRGSWDTVETAADGSDRPNRRLEVVCEVTVEAAVARWADSAAGGDR